MKSSKKSQYSMEFLIFFASLSILFFIWVVVYSDIVEQVYNERHEKAVTDLGKAIQKHISVASRAHEGYSSSELFIPDKLLNKDFQITNTNYVFVLNYMGNDYTYHTPFMNGTLKKGQNILYNKGGTVCINSSDCVSTAAIFQCGDMIDNDEDFLLDYEDGGCYYNYTNASYRIDLNDEVTFDHTSYYTPPDEEVYNYYILCKNANRTHLCGNLTYFQTVSVNLILSEGQGVRQERCHALTAEGFCPGYVNPFVPITPTNDYTCCPYGFHNDSSVSGIIGLGLWEYLSDVPGYPVNSPVNIDELKDLFEWRTNVYGEFPPRNCSTIPYNTGPSPNSKIMDIARKIDPTLPGPTC